jgi:hypothetical protein
VERVWPSDTVAARHLNDAMYFSLLNYSRMDWLLTATRGDVGAAFRAPNGGSALYFLREAFPLTRVAVTTRLAGVDSKWVYLAHSFEALAPPRSSAAGGPARTSVGAYAVGYSRLVFKGSGGATLAPADVLARCGAPVPPALQLAPLPEPASDAEEAAAAGVRMQQLLHAALAVRRLGDGLGCDAADAPAAAASPPGLR